VGIGFSIAEFTYYKITLEERKQILDGVIVKLEELMTDFYQPGYMSFWDRLENEKPEDLLTFDLQD